MSQRLKSWESPRHEGRNDKGKGGSARQRQKKKQLQMLRKKLKAGINPLEKRDGASAISFFFNIVRRHEAPPHNAWVSHNYKKRVAMPSITTLFYNP
ncbi:hypothetical protein HCU40_16530 [Pseudanabaena biceps]|nr:hypothetical protein [Pseudanabaena biceps]